MTVRKLESTEWPTYRLLRLRALNDSPDAFGSTLVAEEALGADDWAARLANGARSGVNLPLIAETDGIPAGLAWARVDASNSSFVNLYQMWVAPEFRGRGVGRMLLRTAIDWARARKADSVHLGVTDGDTPAMRLYVSEGFSPAGPKESLRLGSALQVQPMILRLNDDAAHAECYAP